MTVDGKVTLMGSANMDRRSFALNHENNIPLCDEDVTASMRGRQQEYFKDFRWITSDEVAPFRRGVRLCNNALAIVGPVLYCAHGWLGPVHGAMISYCRLMSPGSMLPDYWP